MANAPIQGHLPIKNSSMSLSCPELITQGKREYF